jgi:hypothetical protein
VDWNLIIAISTSISAFAVVITVIYIAKQIRLNTKAIKAQTYQSIVNSVLEIDKILVQNENILKIWIKGRHKLNSLSNKQKQQFFTLMVMFFHNFENLYFQNKKSLVESQLFHSWQSFGIRVSQEKGGQFWLNKYGKYFLSVEFRYYLKRESKNQ